MQFLKAIATAVTYFQAVVSISTIIEDADAECGALGVMKVDNDTLPPGVNLDNVRKCLNHPESLLFENGEKKTFKRKCWKGGQYGCSHKGYCWRQCGPGGEWCWAAEEHGFGSWIRCWKWGDCSVIMPCGQGNCDECGCSC